MCCVSSGILVETKERRFVADARRVILLVKNKVTPAPAPGARGIPALPTLPFIKVTARNVRCEPEPSSMWGGSWSPRKPGGQVKPETQQIYDDFERLAKTGKPVNDRVLASKHNTTPEAIRTQLSRWRKKQKQIRFKTKKR